MHVYQRNASIWPYYKYHSLLPCHCDIVGALVFHACSKHHTPGGNKIIKHIRVNKPLPWSHTTSCNLKSTESIQARLFLEGLNVSSSKFALVWFCFLSIVLKSLDHFWTTCTTNNTFCTLICTHTNTNTNSTEEEMQFTHKPITTAIVVLLILDT